MLAQIKEGILRGPLGRWAGWLGNDENRVAISVACLLITRISQVAKQAQKGSISLVIPGANQAGCCRFPYPQRMGFGKAFSFPFEMIENCHQIMHNQCISNWGFGGGLGATEGVTIDFNLQSNRNEISDKTNPDGGDNLHPHLAWGRDNCCCWLNWCCCCGGVKGVAIPS